MSDSAPGRAISGGASPSPVRSLFPAKYERSSDRLSSDLSALKLESGRVIFARGEEVLYSRDQSEIPAFLRSLMFRSRPDAVVQPCSSDEVVEVVKYAGSRNMTIVPRGAGSSPFGGSVPVAGGIVVDMSRMSRIIMLDRDARTVKVEAGARWSDVDGYLEKHGLTLMTCPSSRFSTVGGWIATGGYGINSLSYGHLRESVTSLELVTTDGKRTLLPGMKGFVEVFGSEGQLGIVTSVELTTRNRPHETKPHLVMLSDQGDALEFVQKLLSSTVKPSHVMLESSSRVVSTNKLLGKDYLKNANAVVINIESEDQEKTFSKFLKDAGVPEEKEYLARYLWNERFFPMKVRKLGPGLLGTEVLMPVDKLSNAIERADGVCSSLGIEPYFEVHFLKGPDALLLCFFLTDQSNTGLYTVHAFSSLLLTMSLMDVGGKPYSLGIWNHPFSGLLDRESRVMRAAKDAFDPKGVMNRGKYFSLSGRLRGLMSVAFSPKLMTPLLRVALMSLPLFGRAIRYASGFLQNSETPTGSSRLMRAADECAMCGACIGVCPAYLLLGDERVTARGKLLSAKMMARGTKLAKEHAHRTFLCMRCKACEQVCQSKLQLMDVYDELEAELERLHGRDASEIERFVRFAESSPEYEALIEQGLVIGAPRHGSGGVIGNV